MQTEDEIAQDIVDNRLDSATKADILEQNMGSLHMSLGRWIRNTYGLWERPAWTPVLIDGVDHAEDHPDAISARIIVKVLKKLKHG